MFDTHAIARSLTDANLTAAQADAITAAVRQAAEHDAAGIDAGALVTKNDLRAEIASLEARLIKWMIGVALTATGIVVAATTAFAVAVLRTLG